MLKLPLQCICDPFLSAKTVKLLQQLLEVEGETQNGLEHESMRKSLQPRTYKKKSFTVALCCHFLWRNSRFSSPFSTLYL